MPLYTQTDFKKICLLFILIIGLTESTPQLFAACDPVGTISAIKDETEPYQG